MAALMASICKQCAAEFPTRASKKGTLQVYCSRACQVDGRRAPAKPMPRCLRCDAEVRRARSRCKPCQVIRAREYARDKSLNRHERNDRPCRECGTAFAPAYGDKLKVFCSLGCGYKAAKRAARLKRKAKVRGVTVEPVNPTKVFERDGWRCHLCGKTTIKGKRGTNHPLAPELDHIVPISKGGAHSYGNTACSCRKCNAAKSDRIIGQPSLLAA
jgi:hypothetical protein